MQEMIEPDRTILIVSVVGLIVIWGSVAYHKFVQDSAPAVDDPDLPGDDGAADVGQDADDSPSTPAAVAPNSTNPGAGGKGGRKRKKGNKGR
ncbi:MAG: hypothetical protein HN712_16555 [Gemmatimonadetes bacterium]|jgi:hypothetical protein|nr:hypothetical protein [Gemmatimonadota bacterium]MBT6147464.1 hypothetical protein [Gemmatimonadota bacterium]MBT7861928.1 hypothetical protein [Gemmatimonadota bacterium]